MLKFSIQSQGLEFLTSRILIFAHNHQARAFGQCDHYLKFCQINPQNLAQETKILANLVTLLPPLSSLLHFVLVFLLMENEKPFYSRTCTNQSPFICLNTMTHFIVSILEHLKCVSFNFWSTLLLHLNLIQICPFFPALLKS